MEATYQKISKIPSMKMQWYVFKQKYINKEKKFKTIFFKAHGDVNVKY